MGWKNHHVATRRHAGMVFTGLLVALMMGMLAAAYWSGQQQKRAAEALRGAEQARAMAEQRVADAERQAQLAVLAQDLDERLEWTNYRDSQWGARQVSLRQVQLDRDELERVLNDVLLGESRHFAVESLDLAVTHVDAGLFDVNEVVDQPLRLTLRGTAYFRLME
ncbi:MAG: hypothetical protein ACP5DC_00165 [Halothiobacillaceae bacterium]